MNIQERVTGKTDPYDAHRRELEEEAAQPRGIEEIKARLLELDADEQAARTAYATANGGDIWNEERAKAMADARARILDVAMLRGHLNRRLRQLEAEEAERKAIQSTKGLLPQLREAAEGWRRDLKPWLALRAEIEKARHDGASVSMLPALPPVILDELRGFDFWAKALTTFGVEVREDKL
ncbi:MAG TPA: hypothetical protein VI759_07335 [Dehalococcoidia bacterium]|nr:hypothetical protein [Dehalococcoidia bacterium]